MVEVIELVVLSGVILGVLRAWELFVWMVDS